MKRDAWVLLVVALLCLCAYLLVRSTVDRVNWDETVVCDEDGTCITRTPLVIEREP